MCDYNSAVNALQHATRQPTAAWTAYLVLGSSLGYIDEIQQAKNSIDHVLSIKPDLNIHHLKEIFPFNSEDHFKLVLDGIKLTGVKTFTD